MLLLLLFLFNAVSFGASPWGKISLTPFLLHFPQCHSPLSFDPQNLFSTFYRAEEKFTYNLHTLKD